MRNVKLFICTALLSIVMSATAFAGEWKQDSVGWWFQKDDGDYVKGSLAKIGSYWYYFNDAGYMQTGWLKFSNGWLEFREGGSCSNPISELDGRPVGAPYEGWISYGSSLELLVNELETGNVVYYNNRYWASPEYVANLKELAERDRITRTPQNTLTPGTIVDFGN